MDDWYEEDTENRLIFIQKKYSENEDNLEIKKFITDELFWLQS